ncbi:MAG: hypothetical protein WCI88_13505 [Chloroflexota bacterium]
MAIFSRRRMVITGLMLVFLSISPVQSFVYGSNLPSSHARGYFVSVTTTSQPEISSGKSPTPLPTPLDQDKKQKSEKQNSILIKHPAPFSSVIDPIEIEADLIVAEGSRIRLELIGEDGEVIARKLYAYQTCLPKVPKPLMLLTDSPCASRIVPISTQLDFAISPRMMPARLQIGISDEQGRTRTLNTVDITLLAYGTPYTPLSSQTVSDRIVIEEPAPHQNITKSLSLSGRARVTQGLPLRVELTSLQGGILASRMVKVLAPKDDKSAQEGNFAIEMPFTIKTPTLALLAIYEPSESMSLPRYITSREVNLLP